MNGHSGHAEPSLVQLFAEPSQSFRDAIVDLINLRDDIEDMARNLPELIRLLGDNDPVIFGEACLNFHPFFAEHGLEGRSHGVPHVGRCSGNRTSP